MPDRAKALIVYEALFDPAHFFLQHVVGPLVPGELERAITWAEELAALMPPGSGHGHSTHRRTA